MCAAANDDKFSLGSWSEIDHFGEIENGFETGFHSLPSLRYDVDQVTENAIHNGIEPRNTVSLSEEESTNKTDPHVNGHGSKRKQNKSLTKRTSTEVSDVKAMPGLTLKKNEPEQKDKVKTKLLSMWNNMKYGWAVKLKTNYSYETPVWLLGKVYSSTPQERDEEIERYGLIISMEEFKQDFSSRIWFTYRQGFPALPKSSLTSDLGWGCMLRTGQMMLAQAFVMHFLGRDWNCWKGCTDVDRAFHRQIIRWFGDMPGDHSPFSIHNLVHYGLRIGKQAGDWYGPSSVAHVLKVAMDNAPVINPLIGDICLYVAQDCTIYKKDIENLCTQRRRSSTTASVTSDGSSHSANNTMQQTERWRAVIILIPVRLGGSALNVIYTSCLKALLSLRSCLGIIGGKPKHSLYFLGWQDEKLVYLDPHCSQDVVDTRSRDFDTRTFHCMSPRKLPIDKMDPSCTIGFYCKTKEEFDEFIIRTQEVAFPPKQKDQYPMFIFSDGSSSDVSLTNSLTEEVEKVVKVRHVDVDRQGNVIKTTMKESEDFVFLS